MTFLCHKRFVTIPDKDDTVNTLSRTEGKEDCLHQAGRSLKGMQGVNQPLQSKSRLLERRFIQF